MIELVSEAAVSACAGEIDFAGAVRDAYVAVAENWACAAPVVRAPTNADDRSANLKFGAAGGLIGGKIGTYWASNAGLGLENHSATILLLDSATGYARAVLAARLLNRLRTAAGDALAVDSLSRSDAQILAVVGAGAQAAFEVRAIARVRALREVRIASRSSERAAAMASALVDVAGSVRACGVEEAVRSADIVVTATAARATLVEADWIAPGTHVSAMGADAVGKQELDPEIAGRARLFADDPQQSMMIGEFQHIAGEPDVTALGDVLRGASPGRTSPDQITVFDSSGLAVQDLFVAEAALQAARAAGLVARLEL